MATLRALQGTWFCNGRQINVQGDMCMHEGDAPQTLVPTERQVGGETVITVARKSNGEELIVDPRQSGGEKIVWLSRKGEHRVWMKI